MTCRAVLAALAVAWSGAAYAASDLQPMPLPSGLEASFHDRIDEAPTWRFRYVAPALQSDRVEFTDVALDMEHLCNVHALPALGREGHAPERIVITLMSEPVEFGAISPGIRQFFESYSVEDNLCIWEVF